MLFDRPSLADAIKSLEPEAEFGIAGNSLEGLIWIDKEGVVCPSEEDIYAELAVLEAQFDIEDEIDDLKRAFAITEKEPIEITVDEGTFTFNGGDTSASKIFGAINLAQALGESDVQIWDIDDVIHTFSYDSAIIIAKTIGLDWRTKAFDLQNSKVSTKTKDK